MSREPPLEWTPDPAAELATLRAEVERLRDVNAMLFSTMGRIARRDFNCAPHQHGMAASAAAEAAITTANVAAALEPTP